MRAVLGLASVLLGVLPALAAPVRLERVEVRAGKGPVVRVRMSGPATVVAKTLPPDGATPARIYLDIEGAAVGPDTHGPIDGQGTLLRVRTGQFDPTTARVVLDLAEDVPFEVHTNGRTLDIVLGESPPPNPALQAAPAPQPPPSSARTEAASPTAPPITQKLPPLASAAAISPPRPAPVPLVGIPAPLLIVDAGHGGRDPGASGLGGSIEKDIVLAVAHALATKLEARGIARPVLTREDDVYLPIDQRLPPADSSGVLFVSLHANACADPSRKGLEIFYGGGRMRPASLGVTSRESARLGLLVARALRRQLGGVRGGPRPARYAVLARNPLPSVLVEIAYLTHPEDALRAQDPAYQDKVTDALADGIAAFLRESQPRL